MNIEQLKALVAIQAEGTFTKAAACLHVTQPALTQQIQGLEDELGEALFVHTGRTKRLTPAGQLVLEHGKAILAGLDRMAADMAAHRDLSRGELTIAGGDNLARRLLLEPLGIFARRWPGIGIHLRNRTSAETLELVRSGGADLGLINLPAGADGLEVRPWRNFSWVAASGTGANTAPGSNAECGSLDWLADQTLILLEEGTHLRSTLDHALARQGLSAKRVLEAGSTDLQLDMAAMGLGLAVVPDYALAGSALRVLPLPGLGTGTIGTVCLSQGTSTACRAFMAVLHQHVL